MPKNREIVRGLYTEIPLRDYELAYIQTALMRQEKLYLERGLKAQASYVRRIREKIKKYFSNLLRKTVAMRRHLTNLTFSDIKIQEKKPQEPTVYLDPNYPKKMPKPRRLEL